MIKRAQEQSHGVASAGTVEQAPEKTGEQEAPSLDTVAPHLLNETRLVGRWCANLRPIEGRMNSCGEAHTQAGRSARSGAA